MTTKRQNRNTKNTNGKKRGEMNTMGVTQSMEAILREFNLRAAPFIPEAIEEANDWIPREREHLYCAAYHAVYHLLITYPIDDSRNDCNTLNDKFRMYDAAVKLLECMTISEFVKLFTDNSDDEIPYKTAKLIAIHGSDTNMGNRTLLIIRDAGSLWDEFYENLMEVSEYMANVTGQSNAYNDFRVTGRIPETRFIGKVYEEAEDAAFPLTDEYTRATEILV